jgi:hypothetical protein
MEWMRSGQGQGKETGYRHEKNELSKRNEMSEIRRGDVQETQKMYMRGERRVMGGTREEYCMTCDEGNGR